MYVTKRNGSTEPVDKRKITRCVERACRGLENVSVAMIVDEAFQQLFDGIDTSDVDRATILSAKARIAIEPNYSYAAARLLLHGLCKEVFGHGIDHRRYDGDYRRAFTANLGHLVAANKLVPRVLTVFDLDRLRDALVPDRDLQFHYLGLQTLYDRYLCRIDARRMETPQAFWMRVAMGLALRESDPTYWALRFYDVMSRFQCCPSTPTLFNAATLHPQLSSCYLSTVEDSIDGIFGCLHDQARLGKFAGGLGVDWTPIRGHNAHIRSTGGVSQGIVNWLKIWNAGLVAVDQGGRRRGVGAAYLELWHVDVFDFVDLRKNTGDDRRRCHDTNTALWVPDLFMERVEAGGQWTLFSPDECPELHDLYGDEFRAAYERCEKQAARGKLRVWKSIEAKDLWRKVLVSLLETGHPWICWKDPCNLRYPQKHQGVVYSSNLCTEVLIHTKPTRWNEQKVVDVGETGVCTLLSQNLGAFVTPGGEIDWDQLAEVTRTNVRMLDDTIDQNYYPTESSRVGNLRNRPVGLGAMGWSDLLHRLGLFDDSPEAADLAGRLQEHVSYHAIDASSDLAVERGAYPTFAGSSWSKGEMPHDTWKAFMEYRGKLPTQTEIVTTKPWDELRAKVIRQGMRNGQLTALAPTATISSILGCSLGGEPDYAVAHVYSTLSGEFTMVNEDFVVACRKLGLWSEDLASRILTVDGDLSKIDGLPDGLKRMYRRVFDMDPLGLIDVAARRAIWVDMSQSFNLYPATRSLKALSDAYFHAWRSGLKTTYYVRTIGASHVEKSVDQARATGLSPVQPASVCRMDDPSCESCQ